MIYLPCAIPYTLFRTSIRTLQTLDNPRVQSLLNMLDLHTELSQLLDKAIIENPPVVIRDGGVSLKTL